MNMDAQLAHIFIRLHQVNTLSEV